MMNTEHSPMVIDTSAFAAVLFGAADAEQYLDAMDFSTRCFCSAMTWFETAAVVAAEKGREGVQRFHELCMELDLECIPFEKGQAEIAFDAWLRYGKGNHQAGLNLGDCASYALARTLNDRLLFKSEGFRATDIPSALP